jgi:hypothetical protein
LDRELTAQLEQETEARKASVAAQIKKEIDDLRETRRSAAIARIDSEISETISQRRQEMQEHMRQELE